ncbi:TetR/AcrR family transcriptional regulator [Nocardioides litoris]|uniref:TetR/AcrR family transcriptional regulator n=1 Tax=Nocardioides litoris TaxID=1926648 RepID=UPI0011223A78|nr:helix-turn-helix domain-containing protein [Nocardioides litoris]
MSTALQDRRRHQTEREIRDAALDLFEERGVDGTTVDDIAHAAGVSPRTVYRYATTKERAALIPDAEAEARFEAALAALDPAAPLVPQVEGLWRDALAVFGDGRSATGRAVLRLWRLVPREPGLLLAAIAVDEERLARAQRVLVDDLGLDALTARVALESTAVVVRVALDHWAAGPRRASLVTAYDEACAALHGQR